MYGPEAGPLSFVVVAALVGLYAFEQYKEWTEPTDEEALKQAYADGEIGEAEFERRMGYLLDDRNEEIVEVVTEVNGVGPKTGRAIAEQFESINAVRAADRDELTDIHDVGDSTADAIQERFSD